MINVFFKLLNWFLNLYHDLPILPFFAQSIDCEQGVGGQVYSHHNVVGVTTKFYYDWLEYITPLRYRINPPARRTTIILYILSLVSRGLCDRQHVYGDQQRILKF